MTSDKHLTVIGAGPKAIALAAKRHVLARNQLPVPTIAIFDECDLAASWCGDYGFTDGYLPLGTPPEKDIGFPYTSRETTNDTTDGRINAEMLDYSWMAFNVKNDARNFAEWIDRGRPRPPHRIWAAYLRWVAEEIELKIEKHRVTEIGLEEGRWRLSFDSRDPIVTDALVITGPGPAFRRIPMNGDPAEKVFDGKTFWTEECKARIRNCADTEGRAAVIGSGETAAAAIAYLAEQEPHFQIDIISREGIVYTRGESFEENRLYSDPRTWTTFPLPVRERFVRRTDRGVFSVANKAILNRREHVSTIAGEVIRIDATNQSAIGLQLKDESGQRIYDLVVDATGFARDWFLDIMDSRALAALGAALPPLDDPICTRIKHAFTAQGITDRRLVRAIGEDLAVEGLDPPLHLPIFAGIEQGPGFPNLGCLGTLSDRILRPHWHTEALPV